MENASQLMSIGRAAQRVHRTTRTIRRWLNEDGMRFVWKGGQKMIRLDDLLLHYRRHMLANPTRPGVNRRAAEGVQAADAPLVVAAGE